MRLAWESFSNPPKAINWQYASARQNAVFSTTAYCPSKTLCPNARTEYIGCGEYRTYCVKSANAGSSNKYWDGSHTNTLHVGSHDHTVYLNTEYLSGIKNDA
ncbi:hypothetical protein H0K13_000554 [Salmonella enterica]|nr:hypothetical protein CGA23_05550 [Salmonella enterica subsp. enterica]EAA2696766.1 hypothetical protein [Salmonella enterica]ECH8185495.1 hypothetical protein [Salmonella enterica subsp. enterica serovar Rissen]ECL7191530.1 hypothetical protein [Salmonella enterica subsp. enterica serovar Muenchen]EEJ6875648.1 hypothetical protein [Salmonella enterica subsp. houtenae]EGF6409324.1 hypothetical protein [Salmonella enterica subsp. enterica serovar 6,8:d:-]EHF3500108.1 hypothetical protein [Sa